VKRLAPIFVSLAALLLYLPFLPERITGWDPIQFALGVGRFDLALHTPHPPGYLGHVMIARLIAALGVDPGRAVLLAGLAAAAAGAGAVYVLGSRLYGKAAGAAAAALFATHPLVWSQAVSGESYPLETLAATLVVLVGLGVGPGASRRRLWAFFVLFGLSGGTRQGVTLFLLPFAMWRLWVARGQGVREGLIRTLGAGIAGAVGVLGWFAPLAALVGGVGELIGAADRQLFDLFGRAYSPLMGASRAAVMNNLDGLWRFVVVAVSFGGAAALVLWPLARTRTGGDPVPAPSTQRAIPAWERRVAFLLWVVPPFLWFILMFAYKAAYLMLLVPMVAVASGAVLARTGLVAATSPGASRVARRPSPAAIRRWTAALVAAVCLGQAALFLSPPAPLVRAFGDTGLPAVLHADAETRAVVGVLEGLSNGDPDGVLVVTRDARFTFRRAMWHLPGMRVLWLIDSDSTGAPMHGVEVCTARDRTVSFASGAEGFWRWSDLPATTEIRLEPTTRTIAWFASPAGPFATALRRGIPLRAVPAERPFEVLVTDLPAGPVRLEVGPYTFVRE
jgi:hypothetical protein